MAADKALVQLQHIMTGSARDTGQEHEWRVRGLLQAAAYTGMHEEIPSSQSGRWQR